MVDLILNGDREALTVALLSRLGIVFVSWIMIIAVCLVDFWAGVSAAKAEGTKLNSHGFRKTIVKIGDYFKVALVGMSCDGDACVSCGACAETCGMGVDPSEDPNDLECIRCGACIKACPAKALSYEFGLKKASSSKETA